MEFRIQYFGSHDRLIYTEQLDADELVDALDRTRAVLKQAHDEEMPTSTIHRSVM